MAKTTTTPFTQAIRNISYIVLPTQAAQSVNTTTGVLTVGGTDSQLIFTAGAEGSIVKSLIIASNDTANRYVSLWMGEGAAGPISLIGTIPVPLSSGYSATGVLVNVDALAHQYIVGLTVDQCGRPVLPLAPSSRLYIGLVASLTALKQLYVSGVAEDF